MSVNYGYARCSTNEDKQDIQRQVNELVGRGIEKEHVYLEYESGTKADRPEFSKLLSIIQPGDTITALEVSRITRSTKQLIDVIELVRYKQLKLEIVGSITIDCRGGGDIDPMSKAFLQMAGVFSELERNMISQRVKSGMRNAAAKGRLAGRPKTTMDDIPTAFLKHYPQYKSKRINISEMSRLCQLSRTTVYKYIELCESR